MRMSEAYSGKRSENPSDIAELLSLTNGVDFDKLLNLAETVSFAFPHYLRIVVNIQCDMTRKHFIQLRNVSSYYYKEREGWRERFTGCHGGWRVGRAPGFVPVCVYEHSS